MFEPIEQNFQITYRYKLHFTQRLFDHGNTLFRDLIKSYKNEVVKLLFIVDDKVDKLHDTLLQDLKSYCEKYDGNLQHTATLVVEGGESSKNKSSNVELVLEAINKHAICRHSFVVVIGGGAVIDMAGYAAAIAHRGVKLIRVPTTVLSQNDAAVGVKNGINFFGKKNFVGTFAPPYAIINDVEFLKTLEQRDWIAGVAEALKVALIKDVTFFKYLEKHAEKLALRDMETMSYVIYKCAEIHMQHIAQGGDPFESGSSRPLDFGHWAAHKLEQMTNYELRHGEAVAKGIILDLAYAYLIGFISRADFDRIANVFRTIGFELDFPFATDEEIVQLLKGIQEFREHLGGKLTITLISEIGEKQDVHQIDPNIMKKALNLVNAAYKNKVA